MVGWGSLPWGTGTWGGTNVTLAAVEPAAGHTGGRTVVRITGSGFRLPTPPAATGKTTSPPPSMRVTFGGAEATNIGVTEEGELWCSTPIHDPGAVDVVVYVIDDDGNEIDSATLVGAYTYERPDLSAVGELARALGAFLVEARRQMTPNVDWAVSTDYDNAPGDQLNVTYVGRLPALIITDLDLPLAMDEPQASTYDVSASDGVFVERAPPTVHNAEFTLLGIADEPNVILTLLEVARRFFRKNPKLVYLRDDANPGLGSVELQMSAVLNGRVRTARQNDNTNVLWFTMDVRIERIVLGDMPGITTAAPPGIPPWLPHEATVRYGWTAETVSVGTQRKV